MLIRPHHTFPLLRGGAGKRKATAKSLGKLTIKKAPSAKSGPNSPVSHFLCLLRLLFLSAADLTRPHVPASKGGGVGKPKGQGKEFGPSPALSAALAVAGDTPVASAGAENGPAGVSLEVGCEPGVAPEESNNAVPDMALEKDTMPGKFVALVAATPLYRAMIVRGCTFLSCDTCQVTVVTRHVSRGKNCIRLAYRHMTHVT